MQERLYRYRDHADNSSLFLDHFKSRWWFSFSLPCQKSHCGQSVWSGCFQQYGAWPIVVLCTTSQLTRPSPRPLSLPTLTSFHSRTQAYTNLCKPRSECLHPVTAKPVDVSKNCVLAPRRKFCWRHRNARARARVNSISIISTFVAILLTA